MANHGSVKGIDQRPYNRDKFNSEFDRIFRKVPHETKEKENGNRNESETDLVEVSQEESTGL